MIHPEKRRAALAEIAKMEQLTCKQCYHYCHITRGIEKPYTEIHHCSKKEVDLTDITNGCFNFNKREVVDDIPHNPEAKSTGLYDCRGQELFEGDYFMIPNSYFDRQRVAIIRWDKQYKEWRLEDQPPFDGCLRNTLGEHVINVLPWITSAGYKVTEQRIIDMYH